VSRTAKRAKRWWLWPLVAVCLLAAATWASPYLRVHQLREAVAARDAARVAEFVDFPALRANVKAQVLASVGAGELAVQARDNPFAAFDKSLALAVIDPMVDTLVSPAGVVAMLDAGEVRIARKDRPATREEDKVRYDLSYRGRDRVAIAREDGKGGAFILHRHGLWGWKLAGIELAREGAAP
jgi:hypothetical protein